MKIALITGSAKRIGRALALHLSAQHFEIYIHYHTSYKEAKELQKMIPNSKLICADLSKIDADKTVFEQIKKPIDLLINNASIFKSDSEEKFSPEISSQILQANLLTPIKLIHHLTKTQKSANIINIVDSWAQTNPVNFLSYSQSKNSLTQYTKQAADKLPKNFRINAISVGMALHKDGYPKDVFEELSKKYPSSVEGICNAVDSILSDESMNGHIIDITKDAN